MVPAASKGGVSRKGTTVEGMHGFSPECWQLVFISRNIIMFFGGVREFTPLGCSAAAESGIDECLQFHHLRLPSV